MGNLWKRATIAILAFAAAFSPWVATGQTYCTTSLGGSPYDSPIDSVYIAGTTLNNPTPGNPNIYTAFPASGTTTATFIQGHSYTITVNAGTFSSSNMGVWIDFDANGVFDPSEYISVGAYVPGSSSATFTVPATAHTGLTGLRVRTSDSYYGTMGASNACSFFNTGETEDYWVTIDTSAPCVGIPAPGVVSGPDSVCPAQGFTLYLTGATSAVGISYRWASRTSGSGPFTTISGATSSSYTAYGLGATTQFKAYVSCSGGGNDSTAAFTVGTSAFINCYCGDSVTLGGTYFYSPIDSVSIIGTTFNNSTPFDPSTFTVYPASGSTTATLQQGVSYSIVVKAMDYYSDPADISMWIDYNRDGVFEASEWTQVGTFSYTDAVATFTVPTGALTGVTGMRIRSSTSYYATLGADSACSHLFSGETQDYFVTIDTTLPCSGMPAAAVIGTSRDSACVADTFGLTTSGYTMAAGLTFQWLSRPSGVGSFVAIPGATAPMYMVSGMTGSTDYELQITCTAGGFSSMSNIVTVLAKSFINCYCDSGTLGGMYFYSPIDSVTIFGTTLVNNMVSNFNNYSIFPASGNTTASLQQGMTYTIQIGAPSFDPTSIGLWIDYNHNGVYEPSEYSVIATSETSMATANFTVPPTALTGLTGMRLRSIDNFAGPLGSGDACTYENSGTTEDYYVTIDTTLPCTGMPGVGSISGPDSVCVGDSFTVMLPGYVYMAGLSIQWLWAPSGTGTYSAIPGANSPAYSSSGIAAATDFRVAVTCTASGLTDTTAVHSVTLNNPLHCYCSPMTGTPLVYFNGDDDMLGATISGTTFAPSGFTVPSATGYVQLPATVSVNTAALTMGNTYPISVSIDSNVFAVYSVGVWVDFNHSGTFDASEFFNLNPDMSTTGYPGTFMGNISVPTSAMPGVTGMRLVANEDGITNSAGACMQVLTGEIADFLVTLVGGTYCDTVAGLNIDAITSTSLRFSWHSDLAATGGYEYLVDNSPAVPTGSGTVTTDTGVTVTGLPANTLFYVHVRVNCGTGFSQWVTVAVSTYRSGVVSVNRPTDVSLVAFPNPASQQVTIDVLGAISGVGTLMLSDVEGRTIKTLDQVSARSYIDLGACASGIYFITYRADANKKVIKITKE